jgi:hypothetical protein
VDDVELASGPEGLDLLGDCRIMLRFARETGVDLPAELRSDIGELDELLGRLDLPSVSGLSKDFPGQFKASPGAAVSPPGPGTSEAEVKDVSPIPSESGTALVLKVHGALSKLVAPATALTLRATEPPQGKHSVFSRMPRIVKLAALAAGLSAIGFVVSSVFIAQEAMKVEKKTSEEKKSEPVAGAPQEPSKVGPAAVVKEGGAKP